MLTIEFGCCVMVSQAAFSDNKGVIVGSQTGAVLCGHKQMALVCCPQQGGETYAVFFFKLMGKGNRAVVLMRSLYGI